MYSLIFTLLNARSSVICRIKSNGRFVGQYSILSTIEKMAPEKRHEKEARVSYEMRKEKMCRFNSNTVRLEVIGSGAHGAPRSVYLFSECCRYLFNCGEGTQRIATENKIKLSKLPHVFITYPSWENISGLIGMALSVQGIGIPELFIYGHSCIEGVYSATNKFVALRRLKIYVKECDPEEEFSDGIIRMKYVRLHPSMSGNLSKNFSDPELPSSESKQCSSSKGEEEEEGVSYSTTDDSDDEIDYYGHLSRPKDWKVTEKKNKNRRSQSEVCKKKNVTQENFAISYICRTKRTKGTLLIEKCVDVGLRPGPLLGRLKNGEDVELEDGTVVKSCDVTTPEVPGTVIIFVECPSEDYLDSLLKEPAFRRHQTGELNPEDIANVVVHFTSSEVINHPKYQEWINRFSSQTQHLYINENNKSLGLEGVYRQQYTLNLLHPEIFPLFPPVFNSSHQASNNNSESGHPVVPVANKCEPQPDEDQIGPAREKKYFKCDSNRHIKGEALCELYIKPKRNYDYSYFEDLDQEVVIKEVLAIENVPLKLENLKNELEKMEKCELESRKYPKILFLGTGSSQPNKRRNTSGILVFLDEKNTMLLDCGEGTYGQMIRFFGKEKARDILRNLNIIYVSHMHADHHLGLVTLLKERKSAFRAVGAITNEGQSAHSTKLKSLLKGNYKKYQTLFLLAPMQITRWLTLFHKELENIYDLYELIPNAYLVDKIRAVEKQNQCLEGARLKEMTTTYVDHCPNAFGITIVHKDGWKLTYSGDTMPCQNLIDIGFESDILIHEATMDDSLTSEAAVKLHSTTSQAIEVGQKMKAKFILLTHFSQRYSHLPLFSEKFTDNVGVAFDNMIVCFNQLRLLPKMQETLKFLYSEQYDRMEQRKEIYVLNKRKRKNLKSPQRPSKVSHQLESYLKN